MSKAEKKFDKQKQKFNRIVDMYNKNPDDNTLLLYDAIIDLLDSANNSGLLEEGKTYIKTHFGVKRVDWNTFKNNLMLSKLSRERKSIRNVNNRSKKSSSFRIDRSKLFNSYNLNGGFNKSKKHIRKKSIKTSRKKTTYK